MKHKRSVGEILFDSINYLFMVLLSVSMIYPFFNTLAISLSKPEHAVSIGLRLLPTEFSLGAYAKVLESGFMVKAYSNTFFRTVTGTVLCVLACFSVAYVLSKKDLPYRNGITMFLVFTMFFSGGLIPGYLLIKGLGLMNTMGALIVPSIYSVWYIIMMRNFVSTIPIEMEEAAVVDGANPFYIMIRIMLPLSVPIVATVALWSAVGHWNSWFDAMIYITDNSKQVLQVALRKIVLMQELRNLIPGMDIALAGEDSSFSELTIKSATIMLTIGPIILAYPFAQKYYIKGILIGSLKG